MHNELDLIDIITIVAAIFVCIWLIKSPKQIADKKFNDGIDLAKEVFGDEQYSFADSIRYLQGYIEESKTWCEYDDFDKGIEHHIKIHIGETCHELNTGCGGDWYFCEESLKFKDSLTSREIII